MAAACPLSSILKYAQRPAKSAFVCCHTAPPRSERRHFFTSNHTHCVRHPTNSGIKLLETTKYWFQAS
eukprot:6204286-Pleurochrysis_carterae.AAC.1